jgi:hypothetical protein
LALVHHCFGLGKLDEVSTGIARAVNLAQLGVEELGISEQPTNVSRQNDPLQR